MSRRRSSWLAGAVRGSVGTLLVALSTLLFSAPIYLGALAKLAVPLRPWRRWWSAGLVQSAELWCGVNACLMRLFLQVDWRVSGLETLRRDRSYLLVCNHQSWVDVPVLQRVFLRKIPFLRFFLKRELLWIPVLGLTWWALDFPFLRRYRREQIEREPHLRGRDLETARRSCQRFRDSRVTIMSFAEGTRFTPAKHRAQPSPFRHLLKPKAGGLAFVIGALGEQLHGLLDVTIAYPDGVPGIWDFVSGRVRRIHVWVRERDIPPAFPGGSYQEDVGFRDRFRAWVHDIWAEKDQLLERSSRREDA